MKTFSITNILITIILIAWSCSSPSSSHYMILDEVKYIQNFPLTSELQNKQEPDIDIIGIKNLVIYDSIMILSTVDKDGLWYFVSLPNYNYLGNFLTQGQGPFEFIQPPYASDSKLYKKDNVLFASIYDFQEGNLFEMNIGESIMTNQLQISKITDSLPPFLFDFVEIDSTTFFCREVNNNHTQQIRYIIRKDSIDRSLYFLQKLNQASINANEDINILSTITKLNEKNNRIVEMPISLNYINIYSLDGSFGKTICIGEKLDNIGKIQNKNRWSRIYTFAYLCVYDDFWGVVRIDEDEKTYQTGRQKLPSILLFDWQGEPLAELKLNHFITSFDIDFINGSLYTLDIHSDEFYKYDIRDILAKLKIGASL